MTAFVILAPSLSWPVFLLGCAFTLAGLVAVLTEGGRRIVGLFMALGLAGVFVVISDEVCKAMPWLIECWCRWCL